ncbi:MAG: hypothetical protein U0797_00540 [Gemmataceae bacterium]
MNKSDIILPTAGLLKLPADDLIEAVLARDEPVFDHGEALKLGADDPKVKHNYHLVFAGSQKVLHEKAVYICNCLCEHLRLGPESSLLLMELQGFFREGHSGLGFVYGASVRRSHAYRGLDQPGLRVVQAPAEKLTPVTYPLPLTFASGLPRDVSEHLLFARSSDRVGGRARTVQAWFPRTLLTDPTKPARFGEYLTCDVRENTEEEAVFLSGRPPALPAETYLPRGLRDTPIVGLKKVDELKILTTRAIEFYPASHDAASMRTSRAPWRIEHESVPAQSQLLEQALGKAKA